MVSVPKMPANSSDSRTAAVRRASLVSRLRVLQLGLVMMASDLSVVVGEAAIATDSGSASCRPPIGSIQRQHQGRCVFAQSVAAVQDVYSEPG